MSRRLRRWTWLRRGDRAVFLRSWPGAPATGRRSCTATPRRRRLPLAAPGRSARGARGFAGWPRARARGLARCRSAAGLRLVAGPVFCSWVCPLGFVLDLNDDLRRLVQGRLRRGAPAPERRIPAGIGFLFLGACLGLALMARLPVFQTVSPIHGIGVPGTRRHRVGPRCLGRPAVPRVVAAPCLVPLAVSARRTLSGLRPPGTAARPHRPRARRADPVPAVHDPLPDGHSGDGGLLADRQGDRGRSGLYALRRVRRCVHRAGSCGWGSDPEKGRRHRPIADPPDNAAVPLLQTRSATVRSAPPRRRRPRRSAGPCRAGSRCRSARPAPSPERDRLNRVKRRMAYLMSMSASTVMAGLDMISYTLTRDGARAGEDAGRRRP